MAALSFETEDGSTVMIDPAKVTHIVELSSGSSSIAALVRTYERSEIHFVSGSKVIVKSSVFKASSEVFGHGSVKADAASTDKLHR